MEAKEEGAGQSRAGQGTKGMKYKVIGSEKSLIFQQSRAGKDVKTPAQFLVQIFYCFLLLKNITEVKRTTPNKSIIQAQHFTGFKNIHQHI